MSWDRMARAKVKGGMGFRGVSDFNKALLGKNCWRLLTGEESLMGKVFKSRYHPRGSFMEAKLGFLPSYAWRSIMSVREVITKGGKWRIGNREKVRIWHDNWLPSVSNPCVKSQVKILHQDDFVSTLIDQDTKQWNKDLIFSVCRLPVDSFLWNGEKDSTYSVRSAYHQLGVDRRKDLPGSSHDPNDKLWKEIWRVNLPNRIKNFIWRLAKNILPTRGNLCKKGLKIDSVCPLCFNEVETSQHLFMDCNIAKLTWFSSSLGLHVPQNSSLNNWLLCWLKRKDTLGTQLFCSILWKLWFFRNQVVFKQLSPSPPDIAIAALNFVDEFNRTVPRQKKQRQNHNAASPVVHRAHTIRVDAGCFSEGFTPFGCVFKDSSGNIYFSACKKERDFRSHSS